MTNKFAAASTRITHDSNRNSNKLTTKSMQFINPLFVIHVVKFSATKRTLSSEKLVFMRLALVSWSEATWTKLVVLTAYGPPGLCATDRDDFGVNSFFGVQLALLFFFLGVTVSALRIKHYSTSTTSKHTQCHMLTARSSVQWSTQQRPVIPSTTCNTAPSKLVWSNWS